MPDAIRELAAAIQALSGHPASPEVLDRFRRYLDLLLLWNRTHRLTGLSSPLAVVRKLFVDSLLFLPLLPPRPLRLADVGTGAGIPGLPLRLVDPRIALTLIESGRKKVSFLATARRELGLTDVNIVHGRLESTQYTEKEDKFGAVVMRAVGSDSKILSQACHLLVPGGMLLISGPPDAKTWSVRARPELKEGRISEVNYPELGLRRVFLTITA